MALAGGSHSISSARARPDFLALRRLGSEEDRRLPQLGALQRSHGSRSAT